MDRPFTHRLGLLVFLPAIILTLLFQGCTEPNPEYIVRSECKGTIKFVDDNKTNPTGTYTFVKSPSAPTSDCEWKKLYKKNDSEFTGNLYSNRIFKPQKDMKSPPWLADAFNLRLSYDDRTATSAGGFLKVTFPADDATGVWVAFDDRAYDHNANQWKVPHWLKNNFEPTTMKIKSTERLKKKPGEAKAPFVTYGVWRLSNMGAQLKNGCTINLGGNNAAPVAWTGNRGMGSQYLFLTVRKTKPGSAPPARKVKDVYAIFQDGAQFTYGQPELTAALKEEMRKFANSASNPSYKAGLANGLLTVSGKLCDCVDVKQGGGNIMKTCPTLTSQPLVSSGIVQSSGSLDASTSSAALNVTGQGSANIAIDGDIEFRVTEDNQIEIGELHMYGSSATLSGGKSISNLTIGHDDGFVATCIGAAPGDPYRLCSQYEIPPGGFPASGFVTVDGYDFSARLNNPTSVMVTINPTRTRFLIQTGQMQGSIEVDGTTYQVTTQLNLEGPFDNLAPVARVEELEPEYECGDQGLREITLYSGSFDEAQPGDIVTTNWYEHLGTSTESKLATGTSLTRTFGFGPHVLTLEAIDTRGVSNTTDFVVNIVDTRIDSVTPPPDQWLLQQDPAGASSCLGQAFADDICSGSVLISKDASDCDHYPPGMTVVEWTFDDQFGNVETREQRIFVTGAGFFPPPISMMFSSAPVIGPADWYELYHETLSQGVGMVVDEYIIITSPDGQTSSVNHHGDIISGTIEAHRERWTVGGSGTVDQVFAGVFADSLPDPGMYRLETRLVETGSDPLDSQNILASTALELILEP